MQERTEVVRPGQTSEEEMPVTAKRVLVAVDDSEGSGRAISYVADFLGGKDQYRILLFHVLAVPPEDLFSTAREREAWIAGQESAAHALLQRYREVLEDAGFGAGAVETALCRQDQGSLVDGILDKQSELGACTVVVGRNSKSRDEEFLFGSVSSRIVRDARRCSVWVVE